MRALHHIAATVAIPLLLSSMATAQAGAARGSSRPLIRGWLLEHLQGATEAAKALYRKAADDAGVANSRRASCTARLAERAALTGDRDEFRRRLAQLASLGIRDENASGSAETVLAATESARAALLAARQVSDPAARQEALRRARRALLRANRDLEARGRSLLSAAQRQGSNERTQRVSRRRAAQRRAWVGDLRDVMEILQLAYEGKYRESQHLEWFRYGEPKNATRSPTNSARLAARGTGILERIIEDLPQNSRHRRSLNLILKRARTLIDQRDHDQAARLLRVLTNRSP